MEWKQLLAVQEYDGCEACAGAGILSSVLRLQRQLVMPAMDITYWQKAISLHPTTRNPLDLLGDAGFGYLVFC